MAHITPPEGFASTNSSTTPDHKSDRRDRTGHEADNNCRQVQFPTKIAEFYLWGLQQQPKPPPNMREML
jgi:hypothetical protein